MKNQQRYKWKFSEKLIQMANKPKGCTGGHGNANQSDNVK